jgi:hypothetical protein
LEQKRATVVRTGKGQYLTKADFMIENDMKEPKAMGLSERPGVIAHCIRCDAEYATSEPLLQPRCEKCESELGKTRTKSGNGGRSSQTNRLKLKGDLEEFAGAFIKYKDKKPQIANAILDKIASIRHDLRLPELTEDRIKSAKSATDLV